MKSSRYIWYLICSALLLTALTVPYYTSRAENDAPVSIIKSVGINTGTEQSFFPNTATAADLYLEQPLLAEPRDLLNGEMNNQFSWQLLHFLEKPGLNAIITLAIVTSYVGFAILLFVFGKHKKHPLRALWHWLGFFLKKPSLIFLELAPVEADSRWVKAFHGFKKYHRATQVLALASIIALIVKVSLTAGITLYLLDKTRAEVGSSELQDDGKKVHPLDILTYRLDWTNISQQIIPTLEINDPIPAGTTFVEGSLNSSAAHNEQVIIERSGNTSQIRGTVQNIVPGDTGYIIYKVAVDIPAAAQTINSQGSFSIAGTTWNSNGLRNPLETGSIGDLIWKDDDSNQEKNGEEKGLQNVKVTLHLDRSDPQSFQPENDPVLLTATTDNKGKYNFPGITAATYWIIIDSSTLPDAAVSTFNSSPKKIVLAFSNWVSLEKTADYNGADFGFFIPASAPEPAEPATEETDTVQPEQSPAEPTPEESEPETGAPPEAAPQPTENNKETTVPDSTKKIAAEKPKPTAAPTASKKLSQNPAAVAEKEITTAAPTEQPVIEAVKNNNPAEVADKLVYEEPPLPTGDEQWNETSSYPEKPPSDTINAVPFLNIIILLSIIAFVAIISTVSHLQPDSKKRHRTKKRTKRT